MYRADSRLPNFHNSQYSIRSSMAFKSALYRRAQQLAVSTTLAFTPTSLIPRYELSFSNIPASELLQCLPAPDPSGKTTLL